LEYVQFRIPNAEIILVGKYNAEKLEMTASEAAGAFLAHSDPMGLRGDRPEENHVQGNRENLPRTARDWLAVLP
jgi:hypothetical protein